MMIQWSYYPRSDHMIAEVINGKVHKKGEQHQMYIKRIIAAISAAAVMASSGIAVYAEESSTADIPEDEISNEQDNPDNVRSGYD